MLEKKPDYEERGFDFYLGIFLIVSIKLRMFTVLVYRKHFWFLGV
jgi:hypothetical protein